MKKQSLTLRGPLEAFPKSYEQMQLGYIRTAPKPMMVWLCVEARNTLRIDVDQNVALTELRELVEVWEGDITIKPPATEHGQVYLDAGEWTFLGGPRGPGDEELVDGERPSERAMRLSAGKVRS